MPTLDVFKADGFSTANLTDAILKAPYQPGRIGRLGIFRERGIVTTVVQVEEKDGQLSLIPTSPRGGVPDTLGSAKRRLRSFTVPHLARESTIQADEVQGIRSFGTETELETVQALVDERLTDLRAMHEVTLEHLRAGALQGLILDADGSTLFNLFTEFAVSQQTKAMEIGGSDTGTDVRSKCVDVIRMVEAEAGAAPFSAIRGLCSPTFFDALVGYSDVKSTYQYQQGNVLREDLRTAGFIYGGIIWEEYRGQVGSTKFIADDEAYVFPETVGGSSLFATYFAPADFMETVNTLGRPIYAKIASDQEFQRWAKIHSQSNPLPLCLRPRCVVKCTIT